MGSDNLRIAFQDQIHTVVINGTDHYVLFPAYYARFKEEVNVKHSTMTLLNLLSDAIGDYPIRSVLPLVILTQQLGKRIQQATIVIQRSQADLKDTWTCHYFYQNNRLDSVIARNGEEVRFSKKVSGNTIKTYLNIEDRQLTHQTIRYGTPVTWWESYT